MPSGGDMEFLKRRISLLEEYARHRVEDDPRVAPVLAELREGRRIAAIKAWTEAFGASIGEATAAVDYLQRRLKQ